MTSEYSLCPDANFVGYVANSILDLLSIILMLNFLVVCTISSFLIFLCQIVAHKLITTTVGVSSVSIELLKKGAS